MVSDRLQIPLSQAKVVIAQYHSILEEGLLSGDLIEIGRICNIVPYKSKASKRNMAMEVGQTKVLNVPSKTRLSLRVKSKFIGKLNE